MLCASGDPCNLTAAGPRGGSAKRKRLGGICGCDRPSLQQLGGVQWGMSDSPADAKTNPTVLSLVRDLMFASKITATANAAGAAVKVLRDPAALAGQAGR